MGQIQLKGLNKAYPGGVRAIADLDLEVGAGELLVLLGPSGCGKTTLLRLIAGLEEPTSGTISLDGSVVNDFSPRDRDVAMIFQRPALFPHLTVRGNLGFGLDVRGADRSRIEHELGEVADVLGLKEILDRKPASLSGGQSQLVAVGRAMLREPVAYLLDEPFSALDAQLRQRMRTVVREIRSRSPRTAMLYVTHDQAEALALGDRIAVLEAGRCHQVGSPLEVYRRPHDRFVASFVGTPPMNLIDGRLESTNGVCRFVAADITCPFEPGRLGSIETVKSDRVVLGIRPEDLSLESPDATPAPDSPSARVEVTAVEALGHAQLVSSRTEQGTTFTARIGPETIWRRGDTAVVRLDPSAAQLFDGSSGGRNLTSSLVD